MKQKLPLNRVNMITGHSKTEVLLKGVAYIYCSFSFMECKEKRRSEGFESHCFQLASFSRNLKLMQDLVFFY